MKYQLVLQFTSFSETDCDRLLSIEDVFERGSGEMNIFIQTNDPRSAFERSKPLPVAGGSNSDLGAGCRATDKQRYIPIYPQGLQGFAML